MKSLSLSLILFLSIVTNLLMAQHAIRVDTTYSIEQLIKDKFLYGGVEVSNVKYSGATQAIGLFNSSSDSIPLTQGIFLSTGVASQVIGPNNNFGMSGVNNTPGDSSLNKICKGQTYDATIVEFDFIPSSENVAFDFMFASEEYPEFVNTEFNDVFAFLVTDLETQEEFNIAFLPKTYEPITVNNVNHLKNTKHYIDNPAAGDYYFIDGKLEMVTPYMYEPGKKGKKQQQADMAKRISSKCKTGLCRVFQYDGFTKVLMAKAKVTPEKKYHFKIAIADVHDRFYDSGVLLNAHSFKSYDQYGIVKGDTTGTIVKDEDLLKSPEKQTKEIFVEKKEKERIFNSVYFDFDSAELSELSKDELKNASNILSDHPQRKIYLLAHTDSYGNDIYNINLSLQRGKAVKEMLEKFGVDSSKIVVEYFGEKKPTQSNETDLGRSVNRRVEILIK
jgi:outer membrane protein OmpA-like peptidoglycan-associated protein